MEARRLPMEGQVPVLRHPPWLKVQLPSGKEMEIFNSTKKNVVENDLNTVCQEARCPNIHDCWGRGTATFMIAGEECTRTCRFCAVGTRREPPDLDPKEPENLAHAVATMQLNPAVITVVNRDDMEDSGAAHYRSCLDAVAAKCPDTTLELLCSDLAGDLEALNTLLEGVQIAVFAHNVECVPRLDSEVRDFRASFDTSIEVLTNARLIRDDIFTKSSLMVGLGESDDEVVEVLYQLKEAGVQLLTIGQYLAPSRQHHPIARYVEPGTFSDWKLLAENLGFLGVAAGPLVRSSYRAGNLLGEARSRHQ